MKNTQKNGLYFIGKRVFPFLVFLGLWFGLFTAQEANATIPMTFGFQGRLKDSSGTALSSSFSFTFRLYDASSGGTALWTETHPSVTTDQGFFSVRLGSVTPFPDTLDFNGALYLATQVGADAEMSPRLPLNTVPYAYTAGGVNALDAAPVTATGGRMYYDATDGTLNYYDHTAAAWRSLGTATGTLQQVTDGGNVTTNAIQFAGGTSTGGFIVSGSGVTTTNLFVSGTASSSQLYVAGQLVCLASGVNCPSLGGSSDTLATVTARGSFATSTLQLYGGFLASSSTVTSTLTVLGSTSLQNFTFVDATGTNVTTTNLFASGVVSTTELYVAGSLVCLATGTNCPSSTAANLQTVTNAGNTTTNAIVFAGGTSTASFVFEDALAVLGDTSLQGLTFTDATGTNVTTTNLFATNGSFTTLTAGSFTLTDLVWTNATGTNTTSTNLFATNLQATNALFVNATATWLGFTTASGTTLAANAATIGSLTAGMGSFTDLSVARVTSTEWLGFTTASGTTLHALQLFVGGQAVCLANGTNCQTFVESDTLATVTARGSFATSTLQLYGGFLASSSTVTSTFTVLGNGLMRTNALVGTSTYGGGLHSLFAVNGDDLFVQGNIGSASSVYTNGELVVGASSARYGDGYLRQTSGNYTFTIAGGFLLPAVDRGVSLGSLTQRFDGVFGNTTSTNSTSTKIFATNFVATNATTTNLNVVGLYRQNGTPGINIDCMTDEFIGNQTVSGGITTAGACEADTAILSDARLKENVQSVGSVLANLNSVNIVSFDWNAEAHSNFDFSTGTQYGVIADDLELLFPELVIVGQDGYKRVNYRALSLYSLQGVIDVFGELNALHTIVTTTALEWVYATGTNVTTTNAFISRGTITDLTSTNVTTTNLDVTGLLSAADLLVGGQSVCLTDGSNCGIGVVKTASSTSSVNLTSTEVSLLTVTTTPHATTDAVWTLSTVRTTNSDLLGLSSASYRIRRGTSCAAGTTVGVATTLSLPLIDDTEIATLSFVDNPATTTAVAYHLCGQETAGSITVGQRSMITQTVFPGADLGEVYYTHDDTLAPGEVVSLDPTLNDGVRRSTFAYDPFVIGIISTFPGRVLALPPSNSTTVPVIVALTGRAPVRASNENGQIKQGDSLAAAATPGYVMKASSMARSIGRALEDLPVPEGETTSTVKGTIEMFIETSVFLPVSEDGRLINLPTVGPATFGFENRLPVLSSSTLVQFSATTNTALIVNLQNASTGTNASSEYTVTGSLGTTSTHHFKMGVRGSGYSDSNFSITGPNDAYLYTHGANLAIGTASGSSIVFHTAGTQASDERMRITETGWVGIGTPAPSSTLHVIGDAIFSGSVTATRLSVSGIVSSTGAVFHGGLSDSSAGDDALCIDPSTGEIRRAAGATDCTLSSRRFKHDIESLTVGLDALMDLRPVSFKMDGSDQERLGLVAEEVAEIEPRLVFFEEDGVTPRGVRYSEIASLLIKSIQEQQAMIRALQEGRADGLTFHSTATFLGGIVVKEHLYAGQDIAGHARLISGATRVRVTFDKTFLHQPIVTVTPLDFVDSMYRVTDVTIEGFTIQVNAAQSNDKVFAWHAIGSDGGKVFSSDGTTEDIEPVEPDPDEMPGGEPAPAISEPEPEPAPESESISESEPESVSEPEPEAVAEPEPVSEPLVEPEPVSEPELESDTAPEPEPSPEPEQAPATPPPDTGESS